MRLRTRTVVTALSALYLLLLSILAAYALRKAHTLSLPIPNILAALAIALPPLAGVALETTTALVASANNPNKSLSLASSKPKARITPDRAAQILHTTVAFLLIFETAIATLAGTFTQAAECGLRERWQGMFRAKDGEGIRAIQSALGCCGFGSTRDMAWPFPGAGRGVGECVARYDGVGTVGRCLEGLRESERSVAWMLVAVPVGVFLWKCLLLAVPTNGDRSWLPSTIQLPGDGGHRRIEFRDAEEAGEEDSIIDEVRRLNDDSQLASTVEGTRVRPGGLLPRDNTWAS